MADRSFAWPRFGSHTRARPSSDTDTISGRSAWPVTATPVTSMRCPKGWDATGALGTAGSTDTVMPRLTRLAYWMSRLPSSRTFSVDWISRIFSPAWTYSPARLGTLRIIPDTRLVIWYLRIINSDSAYSWSAL